MLDHKLVKLEVSRIKVTTATRVFSIEGSLYVRHFLNHLILFSSFNAHRNNDKYYYYPYFSDGEIK